MAEEITTFDDEELTRKLKSKRRIRGLLIAINFVLFGYLAYQIGANVVNLVQTANQVEGIVPIAGKNQKESLEIYKKYVDNNKIYSPDFVIYGEKIYFSEGNFNCEDIRSIDNVQLIQIEADNSKTTLIKDSLSYKSIGNYLSDGVSLFFDKSGNALKEGDYLFYHNYIDPNNYGETIKTTNNLDMRYEIYSLPTTLEDGLCIRIKSTIYAYKNNPAFVMNIEYVSDLPENYYDVIIVGTEECTKKISISDEFKDQKVKVFESITYKELFTLNCNRLLKVIDEDNQNNERITYSSKLLDDEYNKEKSADDFITNNAGYAMSKGYEYEFQNEHYVGKLTYIIELENE